MTDELIPDPPEAADEPDLADAAPAADAPAETSTTGAAPRRPRWALRTRVAVSSLALVAMMFVFVFPTRSYFAQKRQVGHAQHAVAVLQAQNEQLARQAKQLQTPAEIERLAREQFNMVRPGEQAYNVVPAVTSSAATTTTSTP
jgi:cell division protein FtsB